MPAPTSRIIYNPQVNMGLLGLEKTHPFDVTKFRRAWQVLREQLGDDFLNTQHIDIDRPVSPDELLTVHQPEYLSELKSSRYLAQAFEQPWAALVPAVLIDRGILSPMRWAARGTVIAARAALTCGLAINLGGGFHHAKPDRGEGFCIYSDIALAIHDLRASGALQPEQGVAYIDLDAHQGNGVCHCFLDDRRVHIYDQFNADIYPCSDRVAQDRIDCAVPLEIGCSGTDYLWKLRRRLPEFLDQTLSRQAIGLAIYNAGTDVYQNDDLGMLGLSVTDVLERDLIAIEQLRQRQIPTALVTSGGYSQTSYLLIANSVTKLLLQW